jgi:hypothetical protein
MILNGEPEIVWKVDVGVSLKAYSRQSLGQTEGKHKKSGVAAFR